MKILVICQYYSPEPFRITDICEELKKLGHQVTVVTGIPNYPMGKIYEEYLYESHKDEVLNGVKVHRCFTIGRRTGVFFRFLNYYSYMISSCIYVSKIKEECDAVFVYQLSPVMMAKAGIKYKKKHNKKLVLYCLDLWPESLVARGIGHKNMIYKYFRRVSKDIYTQADNILITSKSFKRYLNEEFIIEQGKINYLPQYAEDFFSLEVCKKEPNTTVDLMFAGNVGAAQSVETIIRAANETKNIGNLRWHIVGDGSSLVVCQQLAISLGLKNVIFHGRRPVEEMPKYYAMADAMLVTMQNAPILSLTVPGKVQTYMAAGKPIIGAINGETQIIIKDSQCGYCADSEDYRGLAACVREFCSDKSAVVLGKNAREYYLRQFSKKDFFEKLINSLGMD